MSIVGGVLSPRVNREAASEAAVDGTSAWRRGAAILATLALRAALNDVELKQHRLG